MYNKNTNKETFGSITKLEDGSVEIISANIGAVTNFSGRAIPKRYIPEGRRQFTLVFNLNNPADEEQVTRMENKGYKFYTSQYDTEPKKYLDVMVDYNHYRRELCFNGYYTKDGVRTPIPEENCAELDRGNVDAWYIVTNGKPCTRKDGSSGFTPYCVLLYAFTEPDPWEVVFGSGNQSGLGADLGPSDDGSLPFEL